MLDKLPKAMGCLARDREELLAFYDYPAVHWVHLRTTNPIESTFATVRLRTKKARGCGSRATTLAMVFNLLETAQKRWKRIKGFKLLELVVDNVEFQDGEVVDDQSDRSAARSAYTRIDNNSMPGGMNPWFESVTGGRHPAKRTVLLAKPKITPRYSVNSRIQIVWSFHQGAVDRKEETLSIYMMVQGPF